MAFVQLQTWDARATGGSPAAAMVSIRTDDRSGPRRLSRRCTASIISVLVHLLLLWLFTDGLPAGIAGMAEEGAPDASIILVDLDQPSSDKKPEPQEAPVTPAPAPPAEVDSSADMALPPPEWSVTRLKIAAPPQAAPATPGQTGSVSPGEGSSGSGSSAFDPYAGAAPLPREAGALDTAALEAIRARVSRTHRNARGTVELIVQVAGPGSVLDSRIGGGTAPAEAKEALRKAVIGASLFAPAPAPLRTLSLPPLHLN